LRLGPALVEFENQIHEVLELGDGVIYGVFTQTAGPVGSSGELQQRSACVFPWVDGKIARITSYADIDEAHAAAERLAEERRRGA
jgi:ketosteroid isomerase-like protein